MDIFRNFVGTPAANFGNPGEWHTVEIKQVPIYFDGNLFYSFTRVGMISLTLNGHLVGVSANVDPKEEKNMDLYLGDQGLGNANVKVRNIVFEEVFPIEIGGKYGYLPDETARHDYAPNLVLKNDGDYYFAPYGTHDSTYDNHMYEVLNYMSENNPDLIDGLGPNEFLLFSMTHPDAIGRVKNEYYEYKEEDPLATAVCCGIEYQQCGSNPLTFDYNEDEASWNDTLNADESKCNALDVSTGKPHVWKVAYPR